MRVVLSFPGCHRRGGVERVMLECANYLQEQGHSTHVLASQWDEEALSPAVLRHSIPVIDFPLLRILSFALASRRELKRMQPSPDVTAAFGVMCPPGGVLWVPSVHKAWMEISWRQRNWKGRLKQRLNLFHPLILAFEKYYIGGRRYGKLIALTEGVKSDLVRLYGVPAEEISILSNGFQPTEFNVPRRHEARAEVRIRLGYGEGQKVVIFVANELERKGFGPLLRAIASLNDSAVGLLAVGRLNPEIYAAEIRRLGMAGRVQFTGPSSDVALFYAAADVFALPTQYEAWGLVIVEAMACGLPVLTSRLAGAAIAVQEGRTGELIDDPNDTTEIARKLAHLLKGNHLPAEEIAPSVSAYGWPNIFQRYEAILKECAVQASSECPL